MAMEGLWVVEILARFWEVEQEEASHVTNTVKRPGVTDGVSGEH